VLFTYLHLAADRAQAEALQRSGATAIAYETVTAPDGSLPLLTPMSEVAGRMSVQVGAHYLEKAPGGRGILLGGVADRSGVSWARRHGTHAAKWPSACAGVTIVDRSVKRLRELSAIFGASLRTEYSTQQHIDALVIEADLVIGAVLIAGAAAPKLVTRDMVRRMKPGAVLVDISIDQGGCFETSKATTHADPTYVVDDVIHYCVANMPGAVPRTSTFALNNANLPFARRLADLGWKRAMQLDPHLEWPERARRPHHNQLAQRLDLPYRPVVVPSKPNAPVAVTSFAMRGSAAGQVVRSSA
jgi:alanine dehydrogenase